MRKISYYFCDLKGQANRTEFGFFLIFEISVSLIVLELSSKVNIDDYSSLINIIYINLIIGISYVPLLAVITRRLNFLKIPSYLVVLRLIPVINLAFVIILFVIGKQQSCKKINQE